VAVLALLGGACRVVEKKAKHADPENVARVRVFYGTDRKPTGHASPGRFYGAESGDLAYGVCEVSVPRDHRMGQYEISWGRKERDPRPETHVMILSLQPRARDAFLGELRAAAQGRPAFVFVHGYNVAFDDAVRRTAQMAYDIGFEGTPLSYSWPSAASTAGYLADEGAVARAVPKLKQFLEDVAAGSGATVVHVIAHSMGNRALVAALSAVASQPSPRFGEAVFAAPDVDAEAFRQAYPSLRGAFARGTLYASSNDRALLASKEIHRGARAGDSGDGIVLAEGLESVDVSAVDSSLLGHSYYGENKSVITDLRLLLNTRAGAARRPGLETRTVSGRTYWAFRG
jgi:esterase/lipase superfamily enzyme